MNIVKIKEFISLRQDLRESGVIGISIWDNRIQLKLVELIQLPNLTVKKHDRDEYPYELSTVLDGVYLFCIFNEYDFEKFPQLKDLISMEEDVDLSGMPDEVNESA